MCYRLLYCLLVKYESSSSQICFIICTCSFQDVPSTGRTEWYDLCGRSAKSKVQGSIKVGLELATREDHGIPIDDNINDIQQHEDLLSVFIDYERSCFAVCFILLITIITIIVNITNNRHRCYYYMLCYAHIQYNWIAPWSHRWESASSTGSLWMILKCW